MRGSPKLFCLTLVGVFSTGLVAPAAGEEAALANAARLGEWDTVSRLIDEAPATVDLDLSGPDGTGAIHWAVRARNTEVVRALTRAGVNVNAVNRYGETPLSVAARDGNGGLLEALLEAGADPAAAERALPDGQTLAMFAARAGSTAALSVLSSRGAIDVNAREQRTETTALMWAALDNRPEAVRSLMELGADPDLRSRLTDYPHLGNGVLLTAPEDGVSFVGQTPLQRGGWTALMYAARSGALEAVSALAEGGADLDALDPLGESALTLAIINGHWQIVETLLSAGADPNVADIAGSTPLYAAVDFHTLSATYGRPAPKPRVVAGSVPVVTLLLEAGAHVDAALVGAPLRRQYTAGDGRLKKGATPLMRAAAAGDITLMRLLLAAGANAGATQDNGNTALLLAAGSAQGAVGSPAHVPVEQAIEAVRLCLTSGADIHAVNVAGRTAVHFAAIGGGAREMIRFLVDSGAPVDTKDKDGKTPLDLALDATPPNEEAIAALRLLAGAE